MGQEVYLGKTFQCTACLSRYCICKGMNTKDEKLLEYFADSGMFQNPDNQIVATIVEDVAFGPENLGIEPAKQEKG